MTRPGYGVFLLVAATLAAAGCRKRSGVNATSAGTALVASLERGPCRGFCPVYRVEVYGDGNVKYVGTQNVNVVGAQSGMTSIEAVQRLIKVANAAEFAGADTSYMMGSKSCGSYVADVPVSTLSMRVGRRMKTIQHDPGCSNAPAFLRTLEAQVDSASGAAKWVAGKGEAAQ